MKLLGKRTAPYFFLTPNMFIFSCFVIFPAVVGFYYSFTNYDGLNPADWVGFSNYIDLFTDKEFWYIFGKTVLYVGVTVPLIYWSALLVGNMLVKPLKAKGFFKYIPELFISKQINIVTKTDPVCRIQTIIICK